MQDVDDRGARYEHDAHPRARAAQRGNGGARPRTIVGASCECADRVSIRLTAISEDGQWSSEPMPDGMYVPAKGDVAFAPRGLFLRLLSPRPLATDEKVEIVLEFKDGEKVPFEAIVAAG